MKLNITQDKYLELRNKGMSKDAIIELHGVSQEKNTVDFLTKLGNFFEKYNIPGTQLGEAVGSSVFGVGQSIKQGSIEPLFEATSQTKPGKVIGDTARSIATIAAPAVPPASTVLGAGAQFGAIGAVSGAGTAAASGGGVKEVVRQAGRGGALGFALGAGTKLAQKGIQKIGDLIGKSGNKIQTSVIKPSKADIEDGFKIETVNKYKLGGSLTKSFEKTDQTIDDLSRKLNTKLASSNESIDLNRAYERTAKKLLGNKLQNFGANASMDRALDQLRGEIVHVSGKNGLVSIPEGQLVKRASGHFGAWEFGKLDPDATARQKVYSAFYNVMKEMIEEASPEGVKEINKQLSELIPVMNALIRRIPVAERSSALSLTDIISLSTATVEPKALSLSLLNLASKSGAVGAGLSKAGPAISGGAKSAFEGVVEPLTRLRVATNQPE